MQYGILYKGWKQTMDTNIKFFDIWTKSSLYNTMWYNNTVSHVTFLVFFFLQHSTSLYSQNWIRSFKPHSKKMFFLITKIIIFLDFSLSCIGEGNGNSLQCSCLRNPREGGAWWASVYGVAQSRTRLKRLSSSSNLSSKE